MEAVDGCRLLIFFHRAFEVFLSTALSATHAVGIAFLGWLIESLGYVWHSFKMMQKSVNQYIRNRYDTIQSITNTSVAYIEAY